MKNETMMLYGKYSQYIGVKSRIDHVPFSGTFELTPRCNMNCKMCYIRMTENEMKKVGSELSVEEWINIGKAAVNKGMLLVLLTGGEAILYKDFKKLYLELRKLGLFITVNTNGTSFNDSWIEFFKEFPPAQINVTVYGGSNETYKRLCNNPIGFDMMKKNVRKMLDNNLNVKLNATFSKDNVDDMEKIYSFGRELNIEINGNTYCFPAVRKEGVDSPEQSRFTPEEAAMARIRLNWNAINNKDKFIWRAKEIFKDINKQETFNNDIKSNTGEPVTCAAGRSTFWVTWDGRVLPCGMIPNSLISLKENTFEEIWNNIVTTTQDIRLSPECALCSKKLICQPCAAKLLAETGDYAKKAEYLCKYTEEYIKLLRKAVSFFENK